MKTSPRPRKMSSTERMRARRRDSISSLCDVVTTSAYKVKLDSHRSIDINIILLKKIGWNLINVTNILKNNHDEATFLIYHGWTYCLPHVFLIRDISEKMRSIFKCYSSVLSKNYRLQPVPNPKLSLSLI